MRKLLPLLLLFLVLLFSCDDSSSGSASSETGSLVLQVITSRDSVLEGEDAAYETKDADELYWTYTAVKADKGLTTGQVTTATPLYTDSSGNVLPGIPGDEFGEFSYGAWTFCLNAYYIDEETGENVAYYKGEETSVTVSSKTNTVSVNVSLVEAGDEEDNGELWIYGIVGYEIDDTELSNPIDFAQVDDYYLYYELNEDYDPSAIDTENWSLDEDKEMTTSQGLTLSVEPGYYNLAIYLVTSYVDNLYDDDIIASAYLSTPVLVKPNATASVSGYLVEGVVTAATLEVVTLSSTEYDEDGDAYESESQIYPGLYTAADGAVDYGTLTLRGTTVTMGEETFTIDDDRSFEYRYAVDYGWATYKVTLSSGTDYTYSTELIFKECTADDDAALADIIYVDTLSGLATVGEDGEAITMIGDSFEYTVASGCGSVTYTVTINDDYSYSTEEAYYTFIEEEDGISGLGSIVLKDGTATVEGDDEGTSVSAYNTFSYTTASGYGEVTYTITLDSADYSYSAVAVSEKYVWDKDSARDLGYIVIDTYSATNKVVTVYTDTSSDTVEQSEEDGTLYYYYKIELTDTGSFITYLITFNSDYTYTTVEDERVYSAADDSEVDLGTITIKNFVATVDGDEEHPVENEDGFVYTDEVSYTGSVKYSIKFNTDVENSSYTYNASIAAIYYVADEEAASLGTVTYADGTAVVEIDDSDSYTVEGDSFSFTDSVSYSGTVTYLIKLDNEDYTYSTEITSETFEAASGSADLNTVTVVSGKATAKVDDSNTYEVTDDSFSFTDSVTYPGSSVTYLVSLCRDDYTYTAELAEAVYIAGDGSEDFGTITLVTETGTATINDIPYTGTIDSDNAFEYKVSYESGGYVIHYIVLDPSTYTYTAAITDELYKQGEDAAELGDISVAYETTATVGSYTTTATVTDHAFSGYRVSYTSGGYVIYTVTLDTSDYTYSTAITSEVYVYSSGDGSLGNIVVAGTTATVGSYTATAAVEDYAFKFTDDVSYADGASVTYAVVLDPDTYTYTTEIIEEVYVEGSTSTGLGSITVSNSNAAIGSDTVAVSSLTSYTPDSSKGHTYSITLSSTDYTYSGSITSTKYIYASGTSLGDIIVSGTSATVGSYSAKGTLSSSSATSFDYSVSAGTDCGSTTYAITLDASAFTYASPVSYYTYVYSSGTSLGNIVIYYGSTSATVGSGSATLSSSTATSFTYTQSAGTGSITYSITLNTSTLTYTAAVSYYTYVYSSGTDLGDIIIYSGSTSATVGSYSTKGTLSSSSATSFTYTPDGSAITYTITLDGSDCSYEAEESYYTFTVSSSSKQDIGDIIVYADGVNVTLSDGTTLTKTSSATSFSCTYSSVSYYDVELDSDDYTYDADKRIVLTYTNSDSTYGTITVTVTNGSISSYSIASSDYGESVYSLSGTTVYISVGYVRFSGSLSKSPTSCTTSGTGGTYSATTLSYVSSLLKGYGEYKFKVKYNRSLLYPTYTVYLGIKSSAVAVCYEASSSSYVSLSAYFDVDEKTIKTSSSTVTFTFTSATAGYITYGSYTLLYTVGGSYNLENDLLYFSTTSVSGYSLDSSTNGLYYLYSTTSSSGSKYMQVSDAELNNTSYTYCNKASAF